MPWVKKNNIEKTSLVTLTDGISHKIYLNAEGTGDYQSIHKIRDTITKKDYKIDFYEATAQTDVLLKIIKDRIENDTNRIYFDETYARFKFQ